MSKFGKWLGDKIIKGLDRLDDAYDEHLRKKQRRQGSRAERKLYRRELNDDQDLRRARASFDGAVALQEQDRWFEVRDWPFFWARTNKVVWGWSARCMSHDRVLFDEDTEVKYGPPAGWGKTRLKAVEDLNRRVEEFMG